jgi:hypothetical protein
MDQQSQSTSDPAASSMDMVDTGTAKEVLTHNLLWGIIAHPVQTLAHIRDFPQRTWLVPAVMAVLLVIAQSLVTVPVDTHMTTVELSGQPGQIAVPEESQIEEMTSRGSGLFLRAVSMIAWGSVVLCGRWAARSGAIHLLSLAVGGRNRFGQVLSMVVWTWVPLLLRSLLQILFIAFGGAVASHQGLAAYLAALGEPLPVGLPQILLSSTQFDVFVLWNLMLLSLGVLIITGLPKVKALCVTVGYWVLATVLSLIPVLVQRLLLSRVLASGGPRG